MSLHAKRAQVQSAALGGDGVHIFAVTTMCNDLREEAKNTTTHFVLQSM